MKFVSAILSNIFFTSSKDFAVFLIKDCPEIWIFITSKHLQLVCQYQILMPRNLAIFLLFNLNSSLDNALSRYLQDVAPFFKTKTRIYLFSLSCGHDQMSRTFISHVLVSVVKVLQFYPYFYSTLSRHNVPFHKNVTILMGQLFFLQSLALRRFLKVATLVEQGTAVLRRGEGGEGREWDIQQQRHH